MDRKEIFNGIKNEIDGYKIRISGENVYLEKEDENFKFTFGIRIQYFGYISMIGLASNNVLSKNLELTILNYLYKPLINLYDNNYTLGVGLILMKNHENLLNKYQNFEVSNQNELTEYIEVFKEVLKLNERLFFEKSKEIKGMAEIMSQFSFEDRDNFSVGGRFPCQIMKKIIIFYLGGQMEKYQEYCLGLEGLFDWYAANKPDKVNDLALFKEGYKYMQEKLALYK